MPEKKKRPPSDKKPRPPKPASEKPKPVLPQAQGRPERSRKTAAKPSAPKSPAPKRPAAKPEAVKPGAAQPEEQKPTTARRVAKRAPRAPSAERRAPDTEQLHIVMVASEAHPFAKTGGLAEVVGALPDALVRLGHRVTVILPRYRGINPSAYGSVATTTATTSGPSAATLTFGHRTQEVVLHGVTLPSGVSAVLVGAPELFERDGLYGDQSGDYSDNAYRFAVLSRAALEYLHLAGERPSILHTHDWQAGMVPVYQKMQFSENPIVGGVPALFTIHNLAFQGLFPSSLLPSLGLGWEVLDVQALEYWGRISYLKGGVNFSEKISTVSPTYAREILTPELGFGFDGVLRRRADDLVGVLNGIDTARWNPSADPFVNARFSGDDLSGKSAAKRELLAAVGLPSDETMIGRPLIGLVSRLTDQKGFDLIAAARSDLMTLDATWVMLGSGERRYEEMWQSLAAEHAQRVSGTIGFHERLAHLIEAGADLFLMPSRFEPCGLNQMYSLRYGTVPIVRAVGGLDDTVTDFDGRQGTGFKFRDYTPEALVGAVRRALAVYPDRRVWRQIQQEGMRRDYSWDASAREYVKLYRAMLNGRSA
jgi:starch synthase